MLHITADPNWSKTRPQMTTEAEARWTGRFAVHTVTEVKKQVHSGMQYTIMWTKILV